MGRIADQGEGGRFSRAAFFIVDANYFGLGLLQARQALLMSSDAVAVHLFLEGEEPETDQERRQFEAVQAQSGGRLFLHRNELSPRIPDSFPCENLPKLVYGRFFAPEIISAERILYLDADILIQGRLDALFDVDLGGHPVAAVHDFGFIEAKSHDPSDTIMTLRSSGSYFNAGVLLIDRARWLGSDLDARARTFFAEHGKRASFQDQDFLNWAYQDDWAHLSPRWNCQSPLIASGLQTALDPVILHFSGILKPWHAESREIFPDYAGAFREMALRAGVPADWRPKHGRVGYTKPIRSLRYRLVRLAAASGVRTGKMKRRMEEWRDRRERSIAFIADMARRGVFVDPVTLRTDGREARPVYDGRRYWAAA